MRMFKCPQCEKTLYEDEYYYNSTKLKNGVVGRYRHLLCKCCTKKNVAVRASARDNPKSEKGVCGRCKKEKPGSEFTADKSNRNGLHYLCKKCKGMLNRDRYRVMHDCVTAVKRFRHMSEGVKKGWENRRNKEIVSITNQMVTNALKRELK